MSDCAGDGWQGAAEEAERKKGQGEGEGAQPWRRRLHDYLDRLFRLDATLATEFHGLQVSCHLLLSSLKSGSTCSISCSVLAFLMPHAKNTVCRHSSCLAIFDYQELTLGMPTGYQGLYVSCLCTSTACQCADPAAAIK